MSVKKNSLAPNFDPFFYPYFAQKVTSFGKYLYVVNVDKIFIRIHIFAHVRIIRMNRIFPYPHG